MLKSIGSSLLGAILVCPALLSAQATTAQGAPKKMRTRDITRLSQFDIANYLKRNDVIFVAVGSVEGNGASPSDKDYASALAVATKMAEAADGVFAKLLRRRILDECVPERQHHPFDPHPVH